jgi:hypothetical protein
MAERSEVRLTTRPRLALDGLSVAKSGFRRIIIRQLPESFIVIDCHSIVIQWSFIVKAMKQQNVYQ